MTSGPFSKWDKDNVTVSIGLRIQDRVWSVLQTVPALVLQDCRFAHLETVHKHMLGGLMQKGWPLKILTLVRGALKITTNFPVKIQFT